MNGNELKSFIKNIDQVINFLTQYFRHTPFLNDLKKCLKFWQLISEYISITTIESKTDYISQFAIFKFYTFKLYEHGQRIFLSNKTKGDLETFYFHVLRFYLPVHIDITFQRHGLGIGIFTLQGFEQQNKESKNSIKRFCNGKGIVCIPNVRRLFVVCKYSSNNF